VRLFWIQRTESDGFQTAMDPATTLSVVATSSKLAKTAWGLGEALYTFTKDARIINKTLANLVEQVRAVRDPCEHLAAFLEGIKHDVKVIRSGRRHNTVHN
jgi:hypothetical protein